MSCHVRWLASASASAFHAAAALDRGMELVHGELADALASPLGELRRQIAATDLPSIQFWRHVVSLSATLDSNRQMAEVVLRKVANRDQQTVQAVNTLANVFTDLEQAICRALPELLAQLALRVTPLRHQWESVGARLLDLIAQQTDQQLIAHAADIVVVHAALGGGGESHLPYNSVRIEAVDTNPHPQLPEIVRLGWLLSQLNNDLPVHSESIHGDCLPLISNLAMVPPTLLAAEELELARYNNATVRLAIDAWRIDRLEGIDLPEIVSQWWETFRGWRPRWGTAMTALSRMIGQQLAALGR